MLHSPSLFHLQPGLGAVRLFHLSLPPSLSLFHAHTHSLCFWALANSSHHTGHTAHPELPTRYLQKTVTNSVRHRVWGFPCPALGTHPLLYQPPERRMKQTNELQGVKITLCLSNLSSNLLAYKLPVSFGYSLLETPFPSSPSFPAPPHPCPTRHDTKSSCSSPCTQGVAPSSGLDLGTLPRGQLEAETLNHPPVLFVQRPTSTEIEPGLGGIGRWVDS